MDNKKLLEIARRIEDTDFFGDFNGIDEADIVDDLVERPLEIIKYLLDLIDEKDADINGLQAALNRREIRA